MSNKPFWDASPVPDAEIGAAADAMRIVSESPTAKERGGVSWHYLAQVGLEAALRVCGGNVQDSPKARQ